jgi:glycosyltransferase involved in cell wall biosynthesis
MSGMTTVTRPLRVVYWSNIPSPYTVERFNELVRRDRLDFEAWFTARIEPDRTWEVDEAGWLFPHRYVRLLHLKGRVVGLPRELLIGSPPDILVSLYDQPAYALAQMAARHRGVRTALWVEATFDRWVTRRAWKEALKRRLFRRADAILVPGPDGRAYAERYRAASHRIHIVPQVIDVDHYRRGHAEAYADRERRREGLGLRGVTYLYVGRLWFGKGLDYLLHAFCLLQQRLDQEVSLLLVGDGIDEKRLRDLSGRLRLRNVVFAGFKQKSELPSWYALADVFVFPTLGDPYGLVVDEAMACSMPVISSTEAGEISQRLTDGVNGYLTPPESSPSLASAMALLARDPALRARMGAAAYARVQDQSPARWADAFERAIERLVATTPTPQP